MLRFCLQVGLKRKWVSLFSQCCRISQIFARFHEMSPEEQKLEMYFFSFLLFLFTQKNFFLSFDSSFIVYTNLYFPIYEKVSTKISTKVVQKSFASDEIFVNFARWQNHLWLRAKNFHREKLTTKIQWILFRQDCHN